jgi:monofunctional biosynthetic peptidoglycan transglycosylase
VEERRRAPRILVTSGKGGSKAGFIRRVAFGTLLLVIFAVTLPYFLTPLYLVVRPVSTLMIGRWITGERVARTYVPLDAVAQVLPLTVIAAEDARFCTHVGIDWHEIREAIEDADDLSEARGGSTISQQTAKNLFLWPGRSFIRKGLELPLAMWIDFVLGKRRVMEIYLNIAEWGPNGEFGIEAGARRAFNKPASQLTAREAALLASILPNPRTRNARQPGPGVRRLAGIYEARARGSGGIDACLRPRRG